jgi:hypothetical protein
VKTRGFAVLAALAVAAAAGASCRSSGPVDIRVSLPGVSPFPAGSFAEIIVTNFRNEAPPPDLDPGLELQSYLATELRRAFKETVSLAPLPDGAAPPPSFWRAEAAGRDRAVFLTGSVRLEGQVRKALQPKNVPVDSPFDTSHRGLIEQRRWTLTVDLAVVSGESGEPLFHKTFREDRDYIDLEKPAEFAFSELSASFRDALFPALLGTPTIEKRTLLRR